MGLQVAAILFVAIAVVTTITTVNAASTVGWVAVRLTWVAAAVLGMRAMSGSSTCRTTLTSSPDPGATTRPASHRSSASLS